MTGLKDKKRQKLLKLWGTVDSFEEWREEGKRERTKASCEDVHQSQY